MSSKLKGRLNLVALSQYVGMDAEQLAERMKNALGIVRRNPGGYWQMHNKEWETVLRSIGKLIKAIQEEKAMVCRRVV